MLSQDSENHRRKSVDDPPATLSRSDCGHGADTNSRREVPDGTSRNAQGMETDGDLGKVVG